MNPLDITPLEDFPKTPYRQNQHANCLRFRWIHAQCYEFKFPDGMHLLTDPYFPQASRAWVRPDTPMLDPDSLTDIDLVVLNHSHMDHVHSLPEVLKRCSPRIVCDRIYARELSAAYRIEESLISPITPGLEYIFGSVRLKTWPGRHGSLGMACDLNGTLFADPGNPYLGPLNSYGTLFGTNYLICLSNGFRIGFAAGTDLDNLKEDWSHGCGPNLLLRQRARQASPEEFAKECMDLSGSLVLPMHQDASCPENADMNAFAKRVNEIFKTSGVSMRMLNPQRLLWYTIDLGIRLCPTQDAGLPPQEHETEVLQ